MKPEQFKEFLKSNEEATASAIQKFVNGKIDKIDKKLEDHIAGENERDKKNDEMYEWWRNLMTTTSSANTIFKYIIWLFVSISTIIIAYFKLKGK